MGQKRLKRFWARVCWMLLLFGGGIAIMGMLLRVAPIMLTGYVLLGIELLVSLIFLRCPNCGKDLAPSRWNTDKRFYCKRCGRPFLFDDDPPDKTETTTKEEP